MTIKILATIEEQDVNDLIYSGLLGIGYWAEILCDDNSGAIFENCFGANLKINETEEEKEFTLSNQSIEKGLGLMLRNYPRHWHDFACGNFDSQTGDIMIQLALFGEVKYG